MYYVYKCTCLLSSSTYSRNPHGVTGLGSTGWGSGRRLRFGKYSQTFKLGGYFNHPQGLHFSGAHTDLYDEALDDFGYDPKDFM